MEKKRAEIGFGEELENLDPSEWETQKGQGVSPQISKEEIAEASEKAGFPSREPRTRTSKKKEKEKEKERYVHRTGRDTQFNTKCHPNVKQRFYDERERTKKPLGEILELAMDAYERELASQNAEDTAKVSKG